MVAFTQEGRDAFADRPQEPVAVPEASLPWDRRSIEQAIQSVQRMAGDCLAVSDPRGASRATGGADARLRPPVTMGKKDPPLADHLFRIGVQQAFIEQLELLERGTDVRLHDEALQQRIVSLMMLHPETHADAVAELLRRGMLEPVIPFFYRTDRSMGQYAERFGFDLGAYMRHFAVPGELQVSLELGQGSGASMRERQALTNGAYLEYGMCDVLRYQIDALILQLIDRDALAQAGAPLTDGELRELAMNLYRIAVIEPGRTGEENIPYDQDAVAEILRDPAAIAGVLRRKARLLARSDVLPDELGDVNAHGEIVHPRKAVRPTSRAYLLAEHFVCEDPEGFLRLGLGPDGIRRQLFPVVHPAGTIMGDFRRIGRLAAKQVDLSFGVRSTAYLTGDDFVRFGCTMTRLLTEKGLHYCDGVRLNFDDGYQVEEAREIEKQTGYPVHIVTGPPRERGSHTHRVPVGLLLTQSGEKMDYLKRELRPEFAVTTPKALLRSADYRDALRPR